MQTCVQIALLLMVLDHGRRVGTFPLDLAISAEKESLRDGHKGNQ